MPDIATNKKAWFDYEILETLEAGIELLGIEVKALRTRGASLDGSFALVRGGEAFLSGLDIPPYQTGNTPADYDSKHIRRLLLSKKEIGVLAEIESKKGLTIVPLSMYSKDGRIKVSLGIVRGKKKYDKRESIKKRDTEHDIGRSLKN
jgi:SsrA-binding protein